VIESKLSASIVPFACSQQDFLPQGCEQWMRSGMPSKHGIHVKSIGLESIVLGFEFPCLTINKNHSEALRICHFRSVCPDWDTIPEYNEFAVKDTIEFVIQYFVKLCDRKKLKTTPAAKYFLNLYGKYVLEVFGDDSLKGNVPTYRWSGDPDDAEDYTHAFAALLPMPEAWFHVNKKILGNEPDSIRVDVAFWTGNRMVVVELQGGSHVGTKHDIARHRLLNSMGNVEIVYLHNDEVMSMAPLDMRKVLPEDVWNYWHGSFESRNPMGWLSRNGL
jgi:hypothetical protein